MSHVEVGTVDNNYDTSVFFTSQYGIVDALPLLTLIFAFAQIVRSLMRPS